MSLYKRDHPRTAAELLIRLHLADGQTVHATTANLSRAGFQVATDPHTVGLLFPEGQQPAPRDRIEARAQLHLTGHHGSETLVIEVRCAAVFARRVAAEQYRVGFQFTSIEAEMEKALGAFVDAG